MKEKFVPIHTLAQELNTHERNIVNWIKAGKITASRIGSIWMVDRSSLENYILTHAKRAQQEKYKVEQLQERYQEIDEMIANLDDFLFSIRSLNKVAFLFRVIINEMSYLLPEPKMQQAFIKISTGESIYNAAQQYGVSYDRICAVYRKCLRIIINKSGFLQEYRNRLAKLERKVRELTLLNEKKKIELLHLSEIYHLDDKKDVSEEKLKELYDTFGKEGKDVIEIYNMSLMDDVKLETRAWSVLKTNDIETVEELYKFVAMFGFDKLLTFEGLGKTTLRRIKYTLRTKGLLDTKDESPLIDFFRK